MGNGIVEPEGTSIYLPNKNRKSVTTGQGARHNQREAPPKPIPEPHYLPYLRLSVCIPIPRPANFFPYVHPY